MCTHCKKADDLGTMKYWEGGTSVGHEKLCGKDGDVAARGPGIACVAPLFFDLTAGCKHGINMQRLLGSYSLDEHLEQQFKSRTSKCKLGLYR